MSKIKLSYKEKTYTLEFNRRTARIIEENGFKLEEIGNQPNKMIPLLFQGAFVKNHQNIKPSLLDDIYDAQTQKSELIMALANMYGDTVKSLVGDEEDESKNSTWELV
jgi:hypothetical protein